MDTDSLMTVSEAAQRLKIIRAALYKAIDAGKIHAKTILGRRTVDKRSFLCNLGVKKAASKGWNPISNQSITNLAGHHDRQKI
jgi:excisionase family DNA binding protein